MREKLLRYFTNESLPEEIEEVEMLLKVNEEARKYLAYLERIWINSEERKVEWDVEKAWNRFSQTAGNTDNILPENNKASKRFGNKSETGYRYRDTGIALAFKYAAMILMTLLVPFLMWQYGFFESGIEVEVQREIVTQKGQFTRITLSDGTRVVLNAESSLSFPERFGGDIRETMLDGEAYFEVTNDSKRPFRVNAGGAMIEVLGTSFNVNTRVSDNGGVNVIVSEGAVSLKGKARPDETPVTIKEGMMSTWSEEHGTGSPIQVDPRTILAWIRGEIVFNSTPLKEVITQLERRYNIIIKVEDESLLSRRLTANYSTESIDDIIKNVALTIEVTYRKENDNFYFLK